MQRRVYCIPAGVFTNTDGKHKAVVILNRKDHLLPASWSDGVDTILCFGGGVEDTDDGDIMALEREMREETAGWFEDAIYPGSKKMVFGQKSDFHSGFLKLQESDVDFGFYTTLVDVGPHSKHNLLKNCKEGLPCFMTLDVFNKYQSLRDVWAGPHVRNAVAEVFNIIRAWNPNIN